MTALATTTPTDLVSLEPADQLATDLTEAEARALTATIRRDLSTVTAALEQAFRGRVWIALGLATWREYIDSELGGALQGLVDVVVRNEVIGVLKDSGMSNYAIAASVGLKSDEPVRRALRIVRPNGVATPTVGQDGKVYVRSAAAAQAVAAAKPLLALPGPKKTTTALDLLEAAGEQGLTIPELQKRKRWTYTQTSTTLSRLNASRDGEGLRRVERLRERRGAYAVYVLPEYVAGRETLQPGQRLPRNA